MEKYGRMWVSGGTQKSTGEDDPPATASSSEAIIINLKSELEEEDVSSTAAVSFPPPAKRARPAEPIIMRDDEPVVVVDAENGVVKSESGSEYEEEEEEEEILEEEVLDAGFIFRADNTPIDTGGVQQQQQQQQLKQQQQQQQQQTTFTKAVRATTNSTSTSISNKQENQPQNQKQEPETTKVSSSSFAERYMQQFGYQKGAGLGRDGTGRVAPVEASTQSGRRGLGMEIKGLAAERIANQPIEEVNPLQKPLWADPCPLPLPTSEELAGWSREGPYRLSLRGETDYSAPEIVDDLLAAKTLLDNVDSRSFLAARNRANPFEGIKREFFQNRAAMKMAELDAMFDYMFSRGVPMPTEAEVVVAQTVEAGTGISSSNGSGDDGSVGAALVSSFPKVVQFADVAAGPGGFSEYLFWKRGWRAKGFGFTLKHTGGTDWKLDKFNPHAPYQGFHVYYGPDGTGDLYNTDNMRALRELVLRRAQGGRLDFVMADGGFDVSGHENEQEILNKQLTLCQFVVGLSLCKRGGHFVCKIFDSFTPFTVGMINLMWRHYERVCVVKPRTSRAANSERYVVCRGLRAEDAPVVDYLWRVNDRLNALKPASRLLEPTDDVVEVVPATEMTNAFRSYITASNDFLGRRQIAALRKLHNFIKDTSLPGENQAEIRQRALKAWAIPDLGAIRSPPSRPTEFFEATILRLGDIDPLRAPGRGPLKECYVSGPRPLLAKVDDWAWVPAHDANVMGSVQLLLGCPHGNSYAFSPHARRWEPVHGLALPMGTCLAAEVFHGRHGGVTVHVVDAFTLASEDVSARPIHERLRLASLFASVLDKDPVETPLPGMSEVRPAILSVPQPRPLREWTPTTNGGGAGASAGAGAGIYLVPRQYMRPLPGNPAHWTKNFDASGDKLYRNTRTGEVIRPAPSSFRMCLKERVYWGADVGISAQQLASFVSHHAQQQR